jgi:hypothetical protein
LCEILPTSGGLGFFGFFGGLSPAFFFFVRTSKTRQSTKSFISCSTPAM